MSAKKATRTLPADLEPNVRSPARLLHLDQGNICVAAYMTDLPPKKLLEKRLHEAERLARHRLVDGRKGT